MNFDIWITIKNEFPTVLDFREAELELRKAGIDYEKCDVGILLKFTQWLNFTEYLNKWENRILNPFWEIPLRIFNFKLKVLPPKQQLEK
jgi:hypothetical protein